MRKVTANDSGGQFPQDGVPRRQHGPAPILAGHAALAGGAPMTGATGQGYRLGRPTVGYRRAPARLPASIDEVAPGRRPRSSRPIGEASTFANKSSGPA